MSTLYRIRGALVCVAALCAVSAAWANVDDDLKILEDSGRKKKEEVQKEAPNTSPCLGSGGGGMSLLGVQMQGAPASGVRGLNPNHPSSAATIAQARKLEDARRAKLAQQPSIYQLAPDWMKDLPVPPYWVRQSIEDGPAENDEALSLLMTRRSKVAYELSRAPREEQQQLRELLAEVDRQIDSTKKNREQAVRRKQQLEQMVAATKAAMAPFNAQLEALDMQAQQMCGGAK